MATGNSEIKHLLKCFCGCSVFTSEEWNHIGGLTASKMLVHERAFQLFKTYLKNKHSGDQCMAWQQLEVFKLCERYLAEGIQLQQYDMDNLMSKGLSSDLENDLLLAISSGSEETFKKLHDIQMQCSNAIDLSQEYNNFKKYIAEQLDYHMQMQSNDL